MPPNSMPAVLFSETDVNYKLSNLKLNKSPGPDLLHPRVIFELRDLLTKPLTVLFNQSMTQGVIPDDWQMSTVTAIFKKAEKI